MNEKTKKLILVVISILVVILFILTVISKIQVKEEDLTEEQKVELRMQAVKQERVNKINQMTERDRIEYYFSEFIKAVEYEKYDEAYKMLNNDFKKNYFPTIDDFSKYVKNNFPMEIGINYNNIERNGSLYVLWITMVNPISVNKDSAKEMNIVIKEHAVGEFEMSFSVEK